MHSKEKNRIVIAFFVIYCALMVWTILFKLSFSIESIYGMQRVNLIPFYFAFRPKFHINEITENFLIFVPFGLYLKIMGVKSKNAVLTGLVFSFLLEICQYVFKIGTSDITDIITNTAGTAFGVVIFVFAGKLLTDRAEKISRITAFASTGLFAAAIFVLLALSR